MRLLSLTPSSSGTTPASSGIAPALCGGAMAIRRGTALVLRPLPLVCAVAAALLLACSQGEGETCQHPRDCDDGLVCVTIEEGSVRSVCRSPEDVDAGAGEPDVGDPDLPEDEDAGGETDRPDASAEDAGDPPADAGDEPADVDAGG
jgi:hypothetical protein